MPEIIYAFVSVAVIARLVTVAVSKRNEARLRTAGAVEHDSQTTKILTIAHILFYIACIGEGFYRAAPASMVTYIGMAIWAASILVLIGVIATLRELWTVKLFISPHHEVRTSILYKICKHPNYFLNILPELVGFAIALQAWGTLIIGLPIYGFILWRRIRAEEIAMRATFPTY
ncbi:isoprenylcysteine carboxylmethyltransferase family protein [Thalassospira lucentensis]|uniref:isoprenylcysteine carboxylmethyltransferase family protein n=1 Tax=Thalassospira lucentensis TaxID=168935 RepID=UPI00142D82E0|nr:isoprenylcysteine carboxylmethyltransferase family protein [Thalassospira lucentensis]NIZ01331.1 hypothetical protein [Thalassospira lucentensis]